VCCSVTVVVFSLQDLHYEKEPDESKKSMQSGSRLSADMKTPDMLLETSSSVADSGSSSETVQLIQQLLK